MRAQRVVLIGLLFSFAATSPALASSMRWAGTLDFEFAAESLSPIAFTGSGVATLNGSSGGIHLTALRIAGGITGSATAPVTDPEMATLLSVRATATLGTGTLSPFSPPVPPGQPQLTRRTLPVRGAVRLCILLPGCDTAIPLALTVNRGRTGVGVGGLLTVGGFTSGTAISLEAAPWTLRTATLPIPTSGGGSATLAAAGWLHGPATLTSSTALTGGSVSLVTPVRVTSDAGQAFGMFTRLTVRFVPEPRPLLVVAFGASGLVALAWKRIQP